jgi:hypothetical protein
MVRYAGVKREMNKDKQVKNSEKRMIIFTS